MLAASPLLWMEDNNLGIAGGRPDDFLRRFQDPETWEHSLRAIDTILLRENSLRHVDPIPHDTIRNVIAPVLNANQVDVAIDTGDATWLHRRMATNSLTAEQALAPHFAWLHALIDDGLRIKTITLQSVLSKKHPDDARWEDYSVEDRIDDVFTYVSLLKQQFPQIDVGIIDALPTHGRDWQTIYRATNQALANYSGLDHVHLDMPTDLVGPGKNYEWSDVIEVQQFVHDQLGAEFGYLLTSADGGNTSARQWRNDSIVGLDAYQDALRAAQINDQPDRIIVTSWFPHPIASVPEATPVPLIDAPGGRAESLTALVRQSSNYLRGLDDWSDARLSDEVTQVPPVAASASSALSTAFAPENAGFARGVVDGKDVRSDLQWQADPTDNAPWLKVDLAKGTYLDQVRLWPYQEDGQLPVIIWVSTTGKGDPHSHPDDWRWVTTVELDLANPSFVDVDIRQSGGGARFASSVAFTFDPQGTTVGLAALRLYSPNNDWNQPFVSPLPSYPHIDAVLQDVFEHTPGAEIATLLADNRPATEQYILSVDDSRFTFDGSLLKLRSGTSLDRDTADALAVWVTLTRRSNAADVYPKLVTFSVIDEAFRDVTPPLTYDFGDAPTSYGTFWQDGGPKHRTDGPYLGFQRTSEVDAMPSPLADLDVGDDGVTFLGLTTGNSNASLEAIVANTVLGAHIDAWIDFNGNGSFLDPGEQIAASIAVPGFSHTIEFAVPESAVIGTTYARVRISSFGGLPPRTATPQLDSELPDGEVEDYRVTINPTNGGDDGTTIAIRSGKWHDASTWNNGIPDDSSRAIISQGITVSLDGSYHVAKEVVVHGTLDVPEAASDPTVDYTKSLTAEWVHVNSGGVFQIGTAADRYDVNDFILNLIGTDVTADHVIETTTGLVNLNNNDGFLMAAMGGQLQFFGDEKLSFTKLAATAQSGASNITVENVIERNFDQTTSDASDGALNWTIGDQIVIASSSYDYAEEEVRTITAVDNIGTETVLTLDSALNHRHYGEIETYGNGTRNWDIDLRAEVALLSRSITIQGTQDTDANFGDRALYGPGANQNEGIGAHTMIMTGAGQITVDGVRFDKMGQTGQLGRYPMHWHLAGDRTGDILRNSSITNSNNRGVTVHGTQNVSLEGNVLHDIHGHGFFMEDASETGNKFLHNITFGIHRVGGGFQPDDPFVVPGITRGTVGTVDGLAPRNGNGESSHDTGQNVPNRFLHSSAYWVTNPDNTWVGNISAGSEGTGFWFALPSSVIGLSKDTGLYDNLNPRRTDLRQFDYNTSHSSPIGLTFDRGSDIMPGSSNHYAPPRTMQINGLTAYKHNGTAVYHRASVGIFNESRFADNTHSSFNTFSQTERNVLFVGHSRGNADPDSAVGGFRLYDGPGHIEDSHFAGFAASNAHTFRIEGGANKHALTRASGITFEHDGTADHISIDLFSSSVLSVNQFPEFVAGRPDSISGLVLDVDGSLTGSHGGGPGHVLTPQLDFYRDSTDVAPPGWNAYISDDRFAQFKIGVVDNNDPTNLLNNRGVDGQFIPAFRIENDDGHAIVADRWNVTYVQRMYTKLNAGDYTVRFLHDVPETGFDVMLQINSGGQPGDHGIFRFVDVGWNHKPAVGTEVASLESLRQAQQTAFYRDLKGDLWINIVASGTGSPAPLSIPINRTDDLVVTNTNDSGSGSLRDAILRANANLGLDTIVFDIGTGIQTIRPQTALPSVSDRLIIDGNSQTVIAIDHAGFESPVQPDNTWKQAHGAGAGTLNGSAWTFTGGAGITRNFSAFQNQAIPAPVGQQHALIQGSGSLRQDVAGFELGHRYELSLLTMARQYGQKGSNLRVVLDAGLSTEQVLRDLDEITFKQFTRVTGTPFLATKPSYTLSIVSDGNEEALSGDRTTFVDEIEIRLAGTNPIAIDGTSVQNGNGLRLNASGHLGGLTIQNFTEGAGILISGGGTGSVIDHVMLGVTADGRLAAPNRWGMRIAAQFNLVRDSVISGNLFDGINIGGDTASDNLIENNKIGTDAFGIEPIPNGSDGIQIVHWSRNTIGPGNVIAYNTHDGIMIVGDGSVQNRITRNTIFANTQLGIDLGNDGPTANDALDLDEGPNELTNHPTITSVATVTDLSLFPTQTLQVQGFLYGEHQAAYELEFFSTTPLESPIQEDHPSYLGSTTVTTDGGNGWGEFLLQVRLPDHAAAPQSIFATATSSSGSTSESSRSYNLTDEPSYDFGDAPDTYRTWPQNGGPAHLAQGPILGFLRTTEADGQPSPNADADEGDDGVTFDVLRVGSGGSQILVDVSNAPASAFIDAWIDFNGNGTFDDSGEQIAARFPVSNDITNAIQFSIPTSAQAGMTYARVRISSIGGLPPSSDVPVPVSQRPDGEVEDYQIIIEPIDTGPVRPNIHWQSFPVIDGDDGATIAKFYVDCCDADDGYLLSVDDSRFRFSRAFLQLRAGQSLDQETEPSVTVRVTLTDKQDAERSFTIDYSFNVRPAMDGNGTPRNYYDFGDAPFVYKTTAYPDSPRHVVGDLRLGTLIDPEPDGQNHYQALGDDIDSDGNDDDGVQFTSELIASHSPTVATVVVESSADAMLDAWIDFNRNGKFDHPQEHLSQNQLGTSIQLRQGENTISFVVPDWAVAGTTYARFRLSSQGGLLPTGIAPDGEIEDYAVTLAQDTVAPGSGIFREHVVSTSAIGARAVFATDVDRDGDVDLLSVSDLNHDISWYENDGQQNFTRHAIGSAHFAIALFPVDMEGDGDLDVVVASFGGNDSGVLGNVFWYENDGQQNFVRRVVGESVAGPHGVFAADMDDDGDLDVLVAASDENTVSLYENDGNQQFTRQLIDSNSRRARGVHATDLDGDGDLDILAASQDDNSVAWYENDSQGNFTKFIIDDEATGTQNAFPADVDGDGDLDVIAGWREGQAIAWYENQGNRQFVRHFIDSQSSVKYVTAVDMDGDGDVDVLAADAENGSVLIYENDETGSFTRQLVADNTPNAQWVTAYDIDRDGDLDVASASWADNKIAWYKSNALPTFSAPTSIDIEEDSPVFTIDIDNVTPGGRESQQVRLTLISTFELKPFNVSISSHDSANRTAQLLVTPFPDAFGSSDIILQLEDAGLDDDFSTTEDNAIFRRSISITVAPLNDPPVAQNAEAETDEDTLIQVLLPVTDVEGLATASASIAAASVVPLGTISFEVISGAMWLTYDPSQVASIQAMGRLESITETIAYEVDDGNGGKAEAIITILVRGKNDWFHQSMPMDVNGNLTIEPLDVLVIINRLNSNGSGPLTGLIGDPDAWYDVNDDGFLSPLDALIIINHLNGGNAEGEHAASGLSPQGYFELTPTSIVKENTPLPSSAKSSVAPRQDVVFGDPASTTDSPVREHRDAGYDLKEMDALIELFALDAVSKGHWWKE